MMLRLRLNRNVELVVISVGRLQSCSKRLINRLNLYSEGGTRFLHFFLVFKNNERDWTI